MSEARSCTWRSRPAGRGAGSAASADARDGGVEQALVGEQLQQRVGASSGPATPAPPATARTSAAATPARAAARRGGRIRIGAQHRRAARRRVNLRNDALRSARHRRALDAPLSGRRPLRYRRRRRSQRTERRACSRHCCSKRTTPAFAPRVRERRRSRLARRRRHGRGRVLDAQLQGRAGDHQPSPVVRSWPMVAGIDGAGTVLERAIPRWKAGRPRRPQRLGRRRDALGLPRRARAPEGRLAGARCRGVHDAPGDGDRHRRLHRDAVRAGARAPRRRSPATARCSSPARPAASAASRSRCSRGSAIASSRRPARPHEARLPARARRRRGRSIAPSSRAPGKPLQKERWAAVDRRGRQPHARQRAGADALRRRRRRLRPGAGHDLPATVMPFILRGVTLAGIDSVMAPLALRQEAWRRLARDLDAGAARPDHRGGARSTARSRRPSALLAGSVRGRIVVSDLSGAPRRRGSADQLREPLELRMLARAEPLEDRPSRS